MILKTLGKLTINPYEKMHVIQSRKNEYNYFYNFLVYNIPIQFLNICSTFMSNPLLHPKQ